MKTRQNILKNIFKSLDFENKSRVDPNFIKELINEKGFYNDHFT